MPFAALSPAALKPLLGVWLFALGGAVGSFLNVVVYRLPAGRSLVRPGSHCPACEHPIRWYDNVPVVSWVLLRGRCRDCRARISLRYPLVEAIAGALFVVIGVVEGLSGAANLPGGPITDVDEGALSARGIAEVSATVVYHLTLLCTLLAAVLVEYDGHRVPVRLFAPALLVGLGSPIVWPSLHPVGAWPGAGGLDGPAAGLVDGMAGLGLGLLLGKIAWLVTGANERPVGLWLAVPCVGLFLGWQAALALAIVTVLLHVPFCVLRRRRPPGSAVPSTAWLAMATLGWIVAWGRIVGQLPFLG